jgi:hypothetical protein
MLPGRRSDNGSLFIQTNTPNGSQVYSGGLALTPLGANYVLNGSATNFVNGFMVTSSGQLCIAPGGVIAKFAMGLPFTADGRLVTQLNQAVIPSDPFVGGVRVGPLGGVYTIDLTPPPFSAFSTGFDEGFA